MNLTTFEHLGRGAKRLVWAGSLTALLLAAGTTAIGDVHPDAKRLADQRRESLSLFAGPTAVLQGNQFQCGLTNDGNGTCTDVFNSPTGGGGFWPTGSPNQYIFNTGIQFAAIMGADGGPWANDTVGALCFDASGLRPSCTAVTNIFDSLNPDDFANWPAQAFVDDPNLFQDVLVGRRTASQQDSWFQYWDGDPSKISGRQHPMGITVTSRSLAWNYPAGNESLVYFIFDAANTTAAGTTQGDNFQRLNEAQFFGGSDALPDAGITYTEAYAAFATDMDVGSTATDNYSTAILPFDIGISYHGGFRIPEFAYSPDIFFPPFFTDAPGIIGVKYLASPIDPATGNQVGLTLFSATLRTGTGTLPDPATDRQLWRYLSGTLNPAQGDVPCSVTAEITNPDPSLVQRSVCFLTESAEDTRFFQASGPFDLPPNESAKIVVAYIAAATVATLPDGSPTGILANNASDNANPPGIPSFHPGFASARGCTDATATSCTQNVAAGANPVKTIERGAGWVAYTGAAPATALEGPQGKIDQFAVTVVPGSLLGRSLVAQTIFDSKFLLGFAPEQPVFYLVPGNSNVTVIWEASSTEDTAGEGDPFFAVASNPLSALFNPNYVKHDVEGYRIWRGSNPGNLQLLAQFDYAGTTFVDFTCETVLPGEDIGNPAGDGFVAGDVCPGVFPGTPVKTNPINSNLVFNNGADGGNPGGGIVRLLSGAAFANKLTTAIIDDVAGPLLPLQDTGVPFVFTDNTAVNNFTYFYSVSAFDVNSQSSGPHTLRSARVAQPTVPRVDSPELVNAALAVSMQGDDGVPLVAGPIPSVNASSGVFSGPFPPSNGFAQSFAPLLPRLLPQLSLVVTIDSIQARASGNISAPTQEFPPSATCEVVGPDGHLGSPFGACWRMFLSVNRDGAVSQIEVPGYNPWWNSFGETGNFPLSMLNLEVAFDQDALDAFGIPSGSGFATASATVSEGLNNSASEGSQARRFGNFHGGARWFDGNSADGAINTVEDPSRYRRVGHLAGIDTIFAPISHTPIDENDVDPNSLSNTVMFSRQCYNRGLGFLDRSADMVATWAGGGITMRDVVHNVDVAFSPTAGPTWGFLTTDANGNGVLDWHDFNYVDGALQILRQVDGGNCNPFGVDVDGDGAANFDENQTASPVSLVNSLGAMMPTSTNMNLNVDLESGAALPQTGMGFGLFVNGHRFIFETSAAPADGTEWTLRTYKGSLAATSGADVTGYSYLSNPAGGGGPLQVLIPGLTFAWEVANSTSAIGNIDLTQVHTVPDPYLGTSNFDLGPTSKQLMFVNLPSEATIRIYSLAGVLIDVLVHDDVSGGGREVWDIRNRNNQFVASGVYFFHVMTPSGDEHVGKFTIINQAGSN